MVHANGRGQPPRWHLLAAVVESEEARRMAFVEMTVLGSVAVVELNDPQRRNALTAPMRDEVLRALHRAVDDGLRVVIVTGRGPSFCAGGDLRNRPVGSEAGREYLSEILGWFEAVESCPLVTVAAVNGHAMGGGAELALACDLVVASDSAVFGFPETRLGLVAPFASSRLPTMMPRMIAKELLMTGRTLTADEAQSYGLVNRVAPHHDLMTVARELVDAVMARSDIGTRLTKELVNVPDLSVDEAARRCAPIFTDPDTLRRIAAFLDRTDREPRGTSQGGTS